VFTTLASPSLTVDHNQSVTNDKSDNRHGKTSQDTDRDREEDLLADTLEHGHAVLAMMMVRHVLLVGLFLSLETLKSLDNWVLVILRLALALVARLPVWLKPVGKVANERFQEASDSGTRFAGTGDLGFVESQVSILEIFLNRHSDARDLINGLLVDRVDEEM